MANLIQQANDLEYVPKDQLIQMSQNPDNNYPSYLVLAEIQRRTQNEKAYAAQQPQPETTVSEELVQEFAGQQGLQGAMAQSPGPQNAFPPSDMSNMAPPSPQMGMPSQQMMGGGLTEYAEGGITGYQTGGGLGLGSDSLSQTFINPMQTDNDDVEVDEDQKNLIKERYTDPDGTFAFGRALNDGFNAVTLAAILAPEPTSTGVGVAARGLVGAGKGLYGAIRNPRQTLDKGLSAIGRIKSRITEGKRFNNPISNPQSASNLPVVANKFRDMGADVIKTQGPRLLGAGYLASQLLPEGVEEPIIDPVKTNTADDNAKIIVNEDVETGKKGFDSDMLIGLGGAILRSNTIGELGGNIADMSTARQARQDSQKLAGIQGRYYEAQTAKLEADIDNMPIKQQEFILKQLDKQIQEGNFASEEEAQSAREKYSRILNNYLAKTGFADSQSPTGGSITSRLAKDLVAT